MISQFILSQIESLIPLLFFPCVLPYPAASVDGRFGGRSIVINSHHIARSIAHVSGSVIFGRGGNNLCYSVAHGIEHRLLSKLWQIGFHPRNISVVHALMTYGFFCPCPQRYIILNPFG